jgi:hypothetical protein
MNYNWSIQKVILHATQRWPIILSYCILGSLIGWIISLVIPSPYRATRELYVGLNIQQLSNGNFTSQLSNVPIANVDDYKNWQMSCLNNLIFTDDIIDETLSQLRKTDNSWNNINRQELAEGLHVYWRNAGKWRLVAENQDPLLANQAISVWQIVVLERINGAISASSQASELNQKHQNLINKIIDNQAMVLKIENIIIQLLEFQKTIKELPDKTLLDDSFLDSLQMIISQSPLSLSTTSTTEEPPNSNSSNSTYQEWTTLYIQLLELEKQYYKNEIEWLEKEQQEVSATYNNTIKNSLGLSSDLIVDGITNNQQIPQKIRPTSLLILIGGFLGLILWAIMQLAIISMN